MKNSYRKRQGSENQDIVDLYWARNEQAIEETENKYGQYCFSIVCNIVHNILLYEGSGRSHSRWRLYDKVCGYRKTALLSDLSENFFHSAEMTSFDSLRQYNEIAPTAG